MQKLPEFEQIYLELEDDQYPFSSITHVRHAARAVCVNKEGKIALTHLFATDGFGKRNYYELPGGGKKENETLEEALVREMEEELGVTGHIITKLGVIRDYYNLIKQENYSHYYLFKIEEETEKHLEERESRLIDKIVYVTIVEAIRYMTEQDDFGVSILVKRRELPILQLVQQFFDKIE